MHEYLDAINGIFETVGAIATWRNFVALRSARMVAGVNWASMAFFTAWGFWNCAYYPALHQWASALAGLALALGNAAWVILAVRIGAAGFVSKLYQQISFTKIRQNLAALVAAARNVIARTARRSSANQNQKKS